MDAPLLDRELSDQFFLPTTADDVAELRALVVEFEANISPRFVVLHDLCATPEDVAGQARRELHSLRGVVANFALTRAADRLRRLETEWSALAAAEKIRELRAAEADVSEGLRALRAAYPFLAAKPD